MLIERWLGCENIGRSRIPCPAIVVSYQLFMNSVDRVDQIRSTNPIRRREKKIHMSLWTYFLDLVLHQSYCIYKTLIENKKISEYDNDDESSADSSSENETHDKVLQFNEFKRVVSEQLVRTFLLKKERIRQRNEERITATQMMCRTVGTSEHHVLMQNKMVNGSNQVACYLCSLILNQRKNSKYGCVQCGKGFHVDCFAAYHNQHALNGQGNAIRGIIITLKDVRSHQGKGTRKRKSNKINSLCNLRLPA